MELVAVALLIGAPITILAIGLVTIGIIEALAKRSRGRNDN